MWTPWEHSGMRTKLVWQPISNNQFDHQFLCFGSLLSPVSALRHSLTGAFVPTHLLFVPPVISHSRNIMRICAEVEPQEHCDGSTFVLRGSGWYKGGHQGVLIDFHDPLFSKWCKVIDRPPSTGGPYLKLFKSTRNPLWHSRGENSKIGFWSARLTAGRPHPIEHSRLLSSVSKIKIKINPAQSRATVPLRPQARISPGAEARNANSRSPATWLHSQYPIYGYPPSKPAVLLMQRTNSVPHMGLR
jgi:hypothetical protein